MGRWYDLPVGESRMRCYLTTPQTGFDSGVLVCMHGPGVDEFIRDICERLAASGYAAIAPDLYHRQSERTAESWTKINDPEALHDMTVAVKALKELSGIGPDSVGVIGFCMGGRLAFLHATHDPQLRAVVVFHGGNILVAREGLPSPLEQARHIRAPVLGLFGAEDDNPSPEDVERIDAELTHLGKAHEFHSYAGAGHAFLNFMRPAVFREAQANDAWAKCVAWLTRYL